MRATWLVCGLGNPGREYAGTRHDLGFSLLARVAADLRVGFEKQREVEIAGPAGVPGTDETVVLVKPLLYMNRSGPPVARLMRLMDLEPSRVLVACDDVHVDLGRIRLRPDGSAGGHNGLKSIIDSLGTGFPRLRMGVGREPEGSDRADWVLARFDADERPIVHDMLERAARVARMVLESGVAAAMTKIPAPAIGARQDRKS